LGTIFLIRCLTMYVTSLSVPGKHLEKECYQIRNSTLDEKLTRAFEIAKGIGMSNFIFYSKVLPELRHVVIICSPDIQ
jgi:hypothetical protein